jgi:DUF438 domain-containing protein
MDKVEQLTRIFKRLDAGENAEKVRHEEHQFLSTVGPHEVALAEQSLLREGVPIDQVRTRCLTHISLLPDQVTQLRAKLPANHIVRIILAEHEMMMCFLADLEELDEEIQQLSVYSPTSFEMRKLTHIVAHLAVAGDHEYREAEVVFPELARHGYFGPQEIVKVDHAGLEACKRELLELTQSRPETTPVAKFKLHLHTAVKYMVPMMRQEILTEDNILYPVAIEVITNKTVWDRIKASCEQIGYCGFDAH